MRDYGVAGQIGLEKTPELYIENLCNVFDEVKRVLLPGGSLWVNIADSYGTGSGPGSRDGTKQKTVRGSSEWYEDSGKPAIKGLEKSLIGIPEMFVLEMKKRGWTRRNTIIWWKRNSMPSSADDRFTVDFEYFYFFTKNRDYYFEQQLEKSIYFEFDKRAITGPSSGGKAVSGEYAINKGGAFRDDGMKNKRCVWDIPTNGFDGAHFATFPEALVVTPIKACSKEGDLVCDPFGGSGTVGLLAKKLHRDYVLIDLNPDYIKIAEQRLRITQPLL